MDADDVFRFTDEGWVVACVLVHQDIMSVDEIRLSLLVRLNRVFDEDFVRATLEKACDEEENMVMRAGENHYAPSCITGDEEL
jgi:hypothetical protein